MQRKNQMFIGVVGGSRSLRQITDKLLIYRRFRRCYAGAPGDTCVTSLPRLRGRNRCTDQPISSSAEAGGMCA